MEHLKIFVTFDAAEEGGIREAQLVTADGQREELLVTIFDNGETAEVELTAAGEVAATFLWDEDAEAVKGLEATADGVTIRFKNAGRTELLVNGNAIRHGEVGEIVPLDPDVALRAAGLR